MATRDGARLAPPSDPHELLEKNLEANRRTDRLHHFLIGGLCLAVATFLFVYFEVGHVVLRVGWRHVGIGGFAWLGIGVYGLLRILRGVFMSLDEPDEPDE